jgi:hypothetical protein
MGGFFSIIGIDRVEPARALTAFQAFESEAGTPIELVVGPSGAIVVLTGDILHDSESIVSTLSESLGVATIKLSYSDDVVWSYDLFSSGKCVDRFSSRPSYFGLPPGVTEADLAGSASIVAATWTQVKPDNIARYLTDKEKLTDEEGSAKAYPDDKHEAWDAWQMTDFMKKLGLDYPVDDEGELKWPPYATLAIATPAGLAEKAAQEARTRELR